MHSLNTYSLINTYAYYNINICNILPKRAIYMLIYVHTIIIPIIIYIHIIRNIENFL